MKLSEVFIAVMAVGMLAGCGSNVRDGLTEEDQVEATVRSLADAAGSEEMFQSMFAGTAPENMQEYSECMFEPVAAAEISGDQATVQVKVTTGLVDTSQGDGAEQEAPPVESSEVAWTLTRAGEEWKIQDAPLK